MVENIGKQFIDIISSISQMKILGGIATLITIASAIPPVFNFFKHLQRYRILADYTSPTQNYKEWKELIKTVVGFFAVFWLFFSIFIILYVSIYAVEINNYISGKFFSHYIYIIVLFPMMIVLFVHIHKKSERYYIDIFLYMLFFDFCISFFAGELLCSKYNIPVMVLIVSICFAIIPFETDVSHNIIIYDDSIFWKFVSYVRYEIVLVVFYLWIIHQEPLYLDSIIILWLITTALHHFYSLYKCSKTSEGVLKVIETQNCNFNSTSMVKYTRWGFIEFFENTGDLIFLNSDQLHLIKYSVYNIFKRKNTNKKWCCELYDIEGKYYFDQKKSISQNLIQFATFYQSRVDVFIVPKKRVKSMIYSANIPLPEQTKS